LYSKKGDILFSKDGTVGKVIEINYDKDFIVLSSLAILRPNKIRSKYLKYVLKSRSALTQAGALKTGTAITRVILKNLKKIKIPYPINLKEQDTIVNKLDKISEIYNKIQQNEYKIETMLEQLPKAVLNKAFTGQLI
jgi:restriction endonuclease S subunit